MPSLDMTHVHLRSLATLVALQPFPLARRVAEMIRSAVVGDKLCDLFPSDFEDLLLKAQRVRVLEVALDAIKLLLNGFIQEL